MRRLMISLSFMFVMHSAFALKPIEMLEVGDKEFAATKTNKSKWLFKLGMDYMKYPTAMPEYTGENESVRGGEEVDITGLGLSFAREFYLGLGLSSNLTLGGFYYKTLDKKVGKASSDYDIEIASVRDGYFLYGYEAALSLNYLFDNENVDVQPYIEFGVGAGHAEIEKIYKRENISAVTDGEELYDISTNEDFTFIKSTLGVNFIAFKGLVSYLEVSSMIMGKNNRESAGKTSIEGAGNVSINSKEDDIDESATITTAQLGIGYFF